MVSNFVLNETRFTLGGRTSFSKALDSLKNYCVSTEGFVSTKLMSRFERLDCGFEWLELRLTDVYMVISAPFEFKAVNHRQNSGTQAA